MPEPNDVVSPEVSREGEQREEKNARVDKRTDAGLPVTTAASGAPDSAAGAGELGLHIDMLDVDRLREWARLILEYGSDISHWGDRFHVASKMQTMATCMEKEIRDVGLLRAWAKSWPADYAALAAKLDSCERRIEALLDALSVIAAPGSTSEFGYWTTTARTAIRNDEEHR